MKKLLALVLCVMMFVSVLSTAAFADKPTTPPTPTWTEGGCSDGEEYYQYYYYANGFLVGTEVNSKKKSYVFVIENTPWDPSLMA